MDASLLLISSAFTHSELQLSLIHISIWACGGALVAMIIAFFSGPLPLQIVAFLVVTTILFFTTRPLAKKHLDNQLVKTHVESLIGKHVIVSADIAVSYTHLDVYKRQVLCPYR